eukprot:5162722-Pleurochrysis_carterae.AAC.1
MTHAGKAARPLRDILQRLKLSCVRQPRIRAGFDMLLICIRYTLFLKIAWLQAVRELQEIRGFDSSASLVVVPLDSIWFDLPQASDDFESRQASVDEAPSSSVECVPDHLDMKPARCA